MLFHSTLDRVNIISACVLFFLSCSRSMACNFYWEYVLMRMNHSSCAPSHCVVSDHHVRQCCSSKLIILENTREGRCGLVGWQRLDLHLKLSVLCHLLLIWLWTSDLVSLSLKSLFFIMENFIILLYSSQEAGGKIKCDIVCERVLLNHKMPCTCKALLLLLL